MTEGKGEEIENIFFFLKNQKSQHKKDGDRDGKQARKKEKRRGGVSKGKEWKQQQLYHSLFTSLYFDKITNESVYVVCVC